MEKPKKSDLKRLINGEKLVKSGNYPEALDCFKQCWRESWSSNKNEKPNCRNEILSIISNLEYDYKNSNKKLPLELFLNFFDDLIKENPKDELLWKGKVWIWNDVWGYVDVWGMSNHHEWESKEYNLDSIRNSMRSGGPRTSDAEKLNTELIKTYEEGLKFLPKSHFLLEGIADLLPPHGTEKDQYGAIEYYKKAIESEPSCLSCLYNLYTNLLFEAENPTEALKYIDVWLKVESSKSKREDIIDLKEAELIKNARKTDFSRTMLYWCWRDSFEEGEKYWRDKLETMYYKGVALMNLCRYDEAIDVFEKIIENFKKLEWGNDYTGFVLRQKGKALIGLKKYKEALSCFDNSLKAWTNSDLKDSKKVISDFFENVKDELSVVENFLHRCVYPAEHWFEEFMSDRAFVLRELGVAEEIEEYKKALDERVKERKERDARLSILAMSEPGWDIDMIRNDAISDIIKDLCKRSKESGGGGWAPRNDIINAAEEKGMPISMIEETLNRLLGDGSIYEPKSGGGYRLTAE